VNQRKAGCLPALLVIVLVVFVALFVVWNLGYVDRWLYEAELERAGDTPVEASAGPTAGSAAGSQAAREAGSLGSSGSSGSSGSAAAGKAFGGAAGDAATEQQPYAYSQLDEEDQRKYRIVLSALVSREDKPYPTDSMDDLNRVFQCVQADHPELFYVNGVSMETVTNKGSGLVERVTVRGRFSYTEEAAALIEGQLKTAASKCLEGMPADADDYGKAKYLYEWLATNVTYDHAAAAATAAAVAAGGADGADEEVHNVAQTVEGALLQGRAVCGGYAGAFQYLMQALGIQTAFVTGAGNGGSHAWCLVLLDGNYYYVDPTWADPQSDGGGGELGYVNYDYLNITTADLERTHGIGSSFPLPTCTATADNYYVREGLLFESADGERLGTLAADAFERGAQLQVRCADEDVYRQVVSEYITSGRVGYYIPGGAYRYSVSDVNLSITLLP